MRDELNFSFKILILGLKPVFSGSVDHRVNEIDANLVKEIIRDVN